MRQPLSFETSWSEAERAMFKLLVAVTKSEENRDAFLGRNPGVLNAWHLEPANTPYRDMLHCDDVPTIAMQYMVRGVFLKREQCLELAMRLVAGLPFKNHEDSNIALLRVAELDNIEYDAVQPANESKMVGYWTVTIMLDFAFATGGKGNSTEAIGG